MANILVVDDDGTLLNMMGLMLKRSGHTIIPAESGEEGIRAAQRDKPDIAIIDLMMPGMNGYEVCRTLRTDPATSHIPLLVLTALSGHEYREDSEEAGADAYVTKPVTADILMSQVDFLLKSGPRNMPSEY